MPTEITSEYLASQGLSPSFPHRFWEKVQKTETCWLWIAAKDECGYGSIGIGGPKCTSVISAHRASWIINRGPIPDGQDVLHNCPGGDNPACVNPDHLWLGDASQNSFDAAKKSRAKTGGHWNNTKMTAEMVRLIREKFSQGGVTKKSLAKEFGVDPSHISKIISKQRWPD